MCRNSLRILFPGTWLWYFIASALASRTCTVCNFIQLLLQRRLKRTDVGQAGDYGVRAEDYIARAGDYVACAGDCAGRAGDYAGCAGVYVGCAGVYVGRAGDYNACAGVYVACAGYYMGVYSVNYGSIQ